MSSMRPRELVETKLLTVSVSEQELEGLEKYCQQSEQTKTEVLRECLGYHLQSLQKQAEEPSKAQLIQEITNLRQ